MIFLKQSTAKTLRIGPFVDEDDGKTAETGLTISQADIRLSKTGGDFAQTNDSSGATHDESGWYSLQLDATDTNTLGPLQLFVHESGALPVFVEFHVLPANIYDSWFSTDKQQVDLAEASGSGFTAGGSTTYDTLFKYLLALAAGNVYDSSGDMKVYDDDDTGTEDGTLLLTFDPTTTKVTVTKA